MQPRVCALKHSRVLRPADEEGSHARRDGLCDSAGEEDAKDEAHDDHDGEGRMVGRLDVLAKGLVVHRPGEEEGEGGERNDGGCEDGANDHAQGTCVACEVHVDEASETLGLDELEGVARCGLEVSAVDGHLDEGPVVEELNEILDPTHDACEAAEDDHAHKVAFVVAASLLSYLPDGLHDSDKKRPEADGPEGGGHSALEGVGRRRGGHAVTTLEVPLAHDTGRGDVHDIDDHLDHPVVGHEEEEDCQVETRRSLSTQLFSPGPRVGARVSLHAILVVHKRAGCDEEPRALPHN
mmetsp:Transcript_10428/g.28393  ORF Transcript_10428/g.28393 Transcript_10428/m.28393 type:complete len:295 (+) Transcript_10428:748-1632(+)